MLNLFSRVFRPLWFLLRRSGASLGSGQAPDPESSLTGFGSEPKAEAPDPRGLGLPLRHPGFRYEMREAVRRRVTKILEPVSRGHTHPGWLEPSPPGHTTDPGPAVRRRSPGPGPVRTEMRRSCKYAPDLEDLERRRQRSQDLAGDFPLDDKGKN